MSDVQSIYIPSSIQDWYREVKFWATDRQYSFCLWIPWTKTIRILTRSTWKHRVLHNTCIKHGRNIKTRCIGSTSTLLWRKGRSSIKHDRTLSFFTKHSQLIVFRKLFQMKLEKSHTRRYMNHLDRLRRFPWNMTGWKSWLQKLLDNQRENLFNKPKVPNQANQIQTQIMIERRNPFIRPQRGASCSQEFETRCFREEAVKHDRKGKPLFAVTQVTEQGHHYRFVESTRSASYSECDDDKAWSSQEWKSDELMDDRTVKPVLCPQRGAPAIRHWGRWSRIRFVVGIQIILQ